MLASQITGAIVAASDCSNERAVALLMWVAKMVVLEISVEDNRGEDKLRAYFTENAIGVTKLPDLAEFAAKLSKWIYRPVFMGSATSLTIERVTEAWQRLDGFGTNSEPDVAPDRWELATC